MKLRHQFEEAIKYHFLWVWQFLFIWGWNGKKNTFNISFWEKNRENCVWSIGDY